MTWAVIAAIGAATYALRASFLLGRGAPGALERYLRFAPVAVLPALAASVLMGADSGLDLRMAAAAVAAGVAWYTRSVAGSMAAGMIALWLLQAWST